MIMTRYLICNRTSSDSLTLMIEALCSYSDYRIIHSLKDINFQQGDLIVFAADMNWMGDDPFITRSVFEAFESIGLSGMQGAILIASENEYFTKRYAQNLIFLLNQKGMTFCGHCLVESVRRFENFKTWQKNYSLPLEEVCRLRIKEMHEHLNKKQTTGRKKILVLHASQQETSNTLMLWEMVDRHLSAFERRVMHIENGNIVDCKGCDFTTCMHYSKANSCFYGGQVTNEILPAIEWADIIVWVCPNYNDAVSAMHSALINRLTVLYRRISFFEKQIYGLIVSGNSGSDSVACQLIGALTINKGFELPPFSMLTAIANDPGSILEVEGIESKARDFAMNIIRNA